jgi:hypothetical protein
MPDITEQQRRDLLSHDLSKPIVRQMLSGYLGRFLHESRNPRKITPADINKALDSYVDGLATMLDTAIAIWQKPQS